MADVTHEVSFDGLIGPTHNYAGLARGNLAAAANAQRVANPKAAALQGLAKMKTLADLGLLQGVLPPHERPHLPTLRRLGFSGADAQVLASAAKFPELLAAVSSASAMWVANAATVSPSTDTGDHRVHFTPANLCSHLHRGLEPEVTGRVLRAIFSDEAWFAHHQPLPSVPELGDEGAANHTRLAGSHGEAGVSLFVYGRSGLRSAKGGPSRFPARQTLEASEAIARQHRLHPERVVFAQQKPAAIDAGVFHNDVIAVGNERLLFYHEQAFSHEQQLLAALKKPLGEGVLQTLRVSSQQVSLADAVRSYLFNSQLVTTADGRVLVVPVECQEVDSVRRYLERLTVPGGPGEGLVSRVITVDLRQSMRNGGGPACLRLRVPLSAQELAAMYRGILLTDALYERLVTWVEGHYRDRLTAEDLADPLLLEESRHALDELGGILGLGVVYDFQRGHES